MGFLSEAWIGISGQWSDFVIMSFMTFIFHELIWLTLNFPYLMFDDYKLFQKYRIQKNNEPIKHEIRWGAFRNILKGHIFQLLPIQIITYPLLKMVGFTAGPELPSWSVFWLQFIVFNIIEDTGFYWVHRYMHTPWAFKNFHSVHHQYIQPFSLTGEIAHPVEFIFNFLIPLIGGPFLMGLLQGVHITTFWFWLFFREARSVDAHSGYNLPFHPLRCLNFIYGGPLAHDFHHQLAGRNSNFGGYKIWDWLMGTDKKFNEWQNKQKSK